MHARTHARRHARRGIGRSVRSEESRPVRHVGTPRHGGRADADSDTQTQYAIRRLGRCRRSIYTQPTPKRPTSYANAERYAAREAYFLLNVQVQQLIHHRSASDVHRSSSPPPRWIALLFLSTGRSQHIVAVIVPVLFPLACKPLHLPPLLLSFNLVWTDHPNTRASYHQHICRCRNASRWPSLRDVTSPWQPSRSNPISWKASPGKLLCSV